MNDLPEDISELKFFQKGTYKIKYYSSIGSTNDAAKEIAKKGNANGLVIIADSQAMGRGRSDHTWFSPSGVNIYLSIIYDLNTNINESLINTLNIEISQAICTAIFKTSMLQAYCRAPNDIYYDNKKLGGVLIESLVCGQSIRYIVVGIGLNVNVKKGDFPVEIQDRATSILIETGKIINRGSLICALLNELKACISFILI
ncbi:MAG: biotin--[acetyl-CoA-carboxylase] ligase [Nitrospirae bacterium]|nr:biotin--[acetyl-CoA-carboxylase] ligase [Nitrospirota bacterium]